VAFRGDPPHFDPAVTTSYYMLGAVGPVYDRLLRPKWGSYANPSTPELLPDLPLGGVVEFGTSSEPIVAAQEAVEGLGLAQIFDVSLKDLLVESPFHGHIAVMIMQGEDAPQWTNRVDLDDDVEDVFGLRVPRVTYKNHDFELRASNEVYKPKMLELIEAAGAEFGFFQPFDPSQPPASRHIMGGLRMGNDPSQSVCNRFGRFHDVENLYCADSGVFPTASGYNPTPTIIAMALRTAAAMVFPNEPEKIFDQVG